LRRGEGTSRLRAVGGRVPEMQQWFGGWGGAAPAPAPTLVLAGTQPRLPSTSPGISPGVPGASAVGSVVEYFSATQNKWIPAKVVSVNLNGTFDLDCKPQVTQDKIRWSNQQNPAGGTAYRVGDFVEYFGASQQRWIPAKVLEVYPDGTCDLDCKPKVPPDKIRRMAPPPMGTQPLGSQPIGTDVTVDSQPGGFRVGATVEYYSASLNKWIPAKVLSVNADGTYNLDCKPEVTADKIRPAAWQAPGSDNGSSTSYSANDVVEYYATSLSKWIPAKVVSTNTNGTYNLDCKPDVPADRVRMPRPMGSGPLSSLASVPESIASNAQAEPMLYRAGDAVEYFALTQQRWIPAKVLLAKPDGTYNLDCKPDVPSERIRFPSSPSSKARSMAGVATYSVGENVEYFGATLSKWIPTKVLAINSSGTYNLDCKADVPAEKIRRPFTLGAGSAAGSAPGTANSMTPPSSFFGGQQGFGFGLDALDAQVAAPDAQGAQLGAPVQLLRSRLAGGRWQHEVCEEGAKALENHGSRRITVASICGPRLTGKSYLLNLLLERTQKRLPPFSIAGGGQGTAGIWLWADSSKEQGPLVAYLDCEGFGPSEADKARDAQLMALCGLLSSVLLVNSRGSIDEGLLALAPACRFSEHVEDRGNVFSQSELVWILRDSTIPEYSQDEWLEKALHSASGQDEWTNAGKREACQSLLRFFGRRAGVALPAPLAEEGQMGRLAAVPFGSLRADFRAGVEALRDRINRSSQGNQKAIAGQPLGCQTFVALVREMVKALNDNRVLNVRGVWETVQHTTCGSISDELRASALQTLHALAAGQALPGGVQLPMTDEALRETLREQRHRLKAHWTNRAVGDEVVRAEYWQELKESLAREEALVRQQNIRLADQKLMAVLRSWQEWLDDDRGEAAAVSALCKQLGQTMDHMPAAPLSRAGRAAVEAAARRVAFARSAVSATKERHGDLQAKAVEWGEQVAHEEGAARSELEMARAELNEARERLAQRQRAEEALHAQYDERHAELQEAKRQLTLALADVEGIRTREHELRSKQRMQEDVESSLRAELEQVRAAAAKANAERLSLERLSRAAADTSAADKRKLEVDIEREKADAERLSRQLAGEREALHGENAKTREEHQARLEAARKQLEEERQKLKGEHDKAQTEHVRMLEQLEKQLEQERKEHAGVLGTEQDRLLDRERRGGILEGQVRALTAETEGLRQRLAGLEAQAREAETKSSRVVQENDEAKRAVEKARAELERLKNEGEEKLRAQDEELKAKLRDEEEAAADRPKPRCLSSSKPKPKGRKGP